MSDTVYLVMCWDYEQTAPVAVFTDKDKAEEYARNLTARHGGFGYAVEELPLVEEVPTEYTRWVGYAFKYRGSPPNHSYVQPSCWDNLYEEPAPIQRDELDKYEYGKGVPFYVVHVEGTSEEDVRRRFAERVAEGDGWHAKGGS